MEPAEKLRLARRAQAIQDDYASKANKAQLEKYLKLNPDELAVEIARLEEATSGEATGASAAHLAAEGSSK
jgi:hypothetical protein